MQNDFQGPVDVSSVSGDVEGGRKQYCLQKSSVVLQLEGSVERPEVPQSGTSVPIVRPEVPLEAEGSGFFVSEVSSTVL